MTLSKRSMIIRECTNNAKRIHRQCIEHSRRQRAPVDRVSHQLVHERVRARPAARDARAAEVEAEPAGDENIAKGREPGLHAAEQQHERARCGKQAHAVRVVQVAEAAGGKECVSGGRGRRRVRRHWGTYASTMVTVRRGDGESWA